MPKFDEESEFSLKVMINKERTQVLFAEADTDFAEALLGFLALPLGEIVWRLDKHYNNKAPVFGSLTTLYRGVRNLKDECFSTECGKQMLLNPISSFFGEPVKCFCCVNINCTRKRTPNVSMYYGTRKCDCGALLSKPMGGIEIKSTQAPCNGILADKRVCFLVTDDLQMAPIEQGCIIQTLINLGITVTQGAELRNVILGYNEIMHLLKGSLLSKTPLTDTILHKCTKAKYVRGDMLHEMMKEPSPNSKKMVVEAVLQQSTNKLKYVLAEQDFVDFIFSFLAIPLSGVECLLGRKTCLKNIDNLYNSIANLIEDKHLSTPDTKNRLIKPDLPPNFLSKNNIFPLSEQMTPSIYYFESRQVSCSETIEKGSWMCFKDPKGDEGSYAKRLGKFIVLDDLTVLPPSVLSATSDVEVLELHIGLKEGLDILKSSLGSSSALTDGLINPILKSQKKQGK